MGEEKNEAGIHGPGGQKEKKKKIKQVSKAPMGKERLN